MNAEDKNKLDLKQDESLVPKNNDNSLVEDAILKKAQNSTGVKDVIDLAATYSALQKQETVDKLVDEKTKELTSDAEAKKIKAETDRVREEVEKVKQEKEKQIAELDKSINAKLKELEELTAEANKAEQFFKNNKVILKCVGVTSPLSLKAMQGLMIPAGILFAIFQILLLPFHLVGFVVESLITIVDSICGKIAVGGWKIAVTIITAAVIVGLVFGIYYLVVWLFTLI